ncbi:MAG: RidA family protein [Pirellulaceae bacterium]|nr:RidA family protein [Pirellulaceae bacterium]
MHLYARYLEQPQLNVNGESHEKTALKGVLEPKGHYSPAFEVDGLVFSSGLLPVDLGTGEPLPAGFESQLETLFGNVEALLCAAGCRKEDVIKVTAYISDVALWGRFDAAYSNFFGSHKPARSVVPLAGKLHYGLDVEMEFIAKRGGEANEC